MYIAPTDLLIVFGKVSEGDGTDVSTWGVSHPTASPIYGTVLLDLEVLRSKEQHLSDTIMTMVMRT